MKVPPKRKGNFRDADETEIVMPLNESPSEKEGKSTGDIDGRLGWNALNESPSEKEGKFLSERV